MNHRIVFARRPVGWVDESCFRIEPCDEPTLGAQDVLLQAVYLSTDPYLRGRMNEGPSYAPGFELGRPIVSRVVARVQGSRHAGFAPGDWVWGFLPWAERCGVPRGGLQSVLAKRIQMTGFIIYDHVHQLAAYQARVAPWLRSGELVFHEDIVQGFASAPAALIGMMRGQAIGKRLVQVAPE